MMRWINIIFKGIIALALVSGCLYGSHTYQKVSHREKNRMGIDSAKVYYINDLTRYVDWDAKHFINNKKYDCVLVVKDSIFLDSLFHGINRVLQEDSLFLRNADAHFVVLVFSGEKTDTLSFDCGPFVVEINGTPYHEKSLFWWPIERISEIDSSWTQNNSSYLSLLPNTEDIIKFRDKPRMTIPTTSKHVYDSAKVYYAGCLEENACAGQDIRTFMRYHCYNGSITVTDSMDLNKLHLLMKTALKQDMLNIPYIEVSMIVYAYSQDKIDTLACGNYPHLVEINGGVLPDESLFWWPIEQIVEKNASWGADNKKWLSAIKNRD